MGRYFRYRNGVDSLKELPGILIAEGDRVSPRGRRTFELRDVMIEIDDPTDVTFTGINRGWNPKIAVAEFLQLVGGFSDARRMGELAPNFKQFAIGGEHGGGFFHGAYGPRISMQMEPALQRLLKDSNSRQSVVTIWDPLHDLMQSDRLDFPCTLSMVFAIRKGKIVMSTHMRSNDIWWGWCYDLFQFAQLQCTVANYFMMDVGPYTHFTNSLHLYERDVAAVHELDFSQNHERMRLLGIGMRNRRSWRQTQRLAYDIFYNEQSLETDDFTNSEAWMWGQLDR